MFAPYEVNGGSTPAIFGMLGVLYVELFQFWQIVDRAWLELIKLTSFVIILLFLGTFPFIDNWAHLGKSESQSIASNLMLFLFPLQVGSCLELFQRSSLFPTSPLGNWMPVARELCC